MSSAGTQAVIGHPMHPDAARVLGNMGGEPSGFRARQLTPRIASSVDLVLTMTRAHRDVVLELSPRQLRRTFTLNEAARLVSKFGARNVIELSALRPQLGHEYEADILDPIGQDLDVFTRVGSLIAEALTPVMELCRHSVTTP